MTQHRHGDVLLTRIGDCELTAAGEREIVVAEGEVTGHAHRVNGDGAALLGERLYLPAGGTIDHEEHGLQVLTPGVYEVRRQAQWHEVVGWRPVRD